MVVARRIGVLVGLLTSVIVQQPCSSPSKSPENQSKPFPQEYPYLQAFCKPQKPPANHRTAFTRQRSLLRSRHRPLSKSGVWHRGYAGFLHRDFGEGAFRAE